MLLEISIFIIAISFLLFAIFSIPSLLQARRTAKKVEVTAQTLNEKLPGILNRFDEISDNLTTSSYLVEKQTENLSIYITRLLNIVDDVFKIEKNVRHSVEYPVSETIVNLTATARGIQAFWQALKNKKETEKIKKF